MGVIHRAKQHQKKHGTAYAAAYLKRQGYSLRAAMYNLTGRVLP